MRSLALTALLTTIAAGCANSQRLVPPEAPHSLRPAEDQSLYLEALATGVQIYECSQKADSTYEWVFKSPEASLVSRSGEPLGKHYAGPTWESTDGSKVVGAVKATAAGPDTSAISWLLLASKENVGSGTLAAAKSIQRLATAGGVPPKSPCEQSNLKQIARVPYTATYYFYR